MSGDKLAVTRQRDACEKLVRERGWELTEVYEDNSVSASDKAKDRPAYARMREAFEQGQFDALVCWDLDRLSRQPRQLEDWIDAAEDRGLVLVTANGDADLSTDNGRLFARIKLAVAKSEVERKSERQRAAARQRAQLGKPPLGTRLTGYKANGDVIEEEADLVREIFARFAAGDSLASIARDLDGREVKTRRGRPWNASSIRGILVNPRYTGRAIYMGKPTGIEGLWSPIVDDETFAVVQLRLGDPRRRTQTGTDRKHLGSGIYLCGVCRLALRSHGRSYRCKAGGHLLRSRVPVDTFVLELLEARLRSPDVAVALQPQGGQDEQTDAEIRTLRARLVELECDYDEGLIDGRRYSSARAKTLSKLEQLERRRANRLGSQAVNAIIGASDPVAALRSAPLMIQRNVVDSFMEVSLLPAPRGSRIFNPDTVDVRWKEDHGVERGA